MSMPAIFLDIAASSGFTLGAVAAAAVFFLAFAVVAFIAYKALKKTLKMGLRMLLVGVILFIAAVGSLSLLYFGFGSASKSTPPQPVPSRAR